MYLNIMIMTLEPYMAIYKTAYKFLDGMKGLHQNNNDNNK